VLRGDSKSAKLGTVFDEADECVDGLESIRDLRIKDDFPIRPRPPPPLSSPA